MKRANDNQWVRQNDRSYGVLTKVGQGSRTDLFDADGNFLGYEIELSEQRPNSPCKIGYFHLRKDAVAAIGQFFAAVDAKAEGREDETDFPQLTDFNEMVNAA